MNKGRYWFPSSMDWEPINHFTFLHLHHTFNTMRKNLLLFIVISLSVSLTGCGGGTIRTVNVTGTVTFNGEPLSGAQVNFSPTTSDEGARPAFGLTDADGKYRLSVIGGAVNAGTTPGEYQVSISRMVGTGIIAEPDGGPTTSGPSVFVPPPQSLIPIRYGDPTTSELTATVEARGNNVFNFDLKSP